MLSWLTASIEPRALGLTRIMIGGAALIRVWVGWRVVSELTHPETLRVPYADWLPQPTPLLVAVIVAVWALSAILFTIGWRVPWTGSVLLAAIVATLALDQQAYSNHLYLMAWFVLLLVLADAGAGLNIHRSDRRVVRWGTLLLMLLMSIVYGFSALTKLNEGFLSGEALAGVLNGGLVGFPRALLTPGFLAALAAIVIVVELFIAILIWHVRFRPAAFLLGLGLHTSVTLLMGSTLELLVFSIEMLAIYPLFLTREELILVWDDDCGFCRGWVDRFRRLDVLRTLSPVGRSNPASPVPYRDVMTSMHLIHLDNDVSGFGAVTQTLEHLVPTLWFAPLLRIPGISHLADRWYRWQARRRACQIGRHSPAST